jgi:hypothetical protein
MDKWGWGYQTPSWTLVGGNRYPVSQELTQNHYTKIAYSDATGGNTDPNRYKGTTPSPGYESTHVFEFTIYQLPTEILDIGILWEGYADQCLQAELYIWDNVAGDWGDGQGNTGQNMYMDNYAGNRDKNLVGHIRQNFERYVDEAGKLTIMLYGERPSYKAFHDYMSITVIHTHHEKSVGYGGPGDAMLYIYGEPLATGNTADLLLTNAPASTTAYLVLGLSFNPTSFKGGYIVPVPYQMLLPMMTNGSGEISLPIAGGGGPLTTYLQFVYVDGAQPKGYGFSNALEVELLP